MVVTASDASWRPQGAVRIVARDIWRRDAIGNFCFQIADLLRAAGVEAVLYAENFSPDEDIRPLADVFTQTAPADILFYHFSIEDPAFEALSQLACARILYFHGITPARFFTDSDPHTEGLVSRGLNQRPLARHFDVLMANSRTTAACLIEGMGPEAPAVEQVLACPPVLGLNRWQNIVAEPADVPQSPRLLLYVGRLSPHKGVDDLLEIFAHLARLDPDVHLAIVGGGSAEQLARLADIARGAGVAERVTFLQNVTDGVIKALYERCDGLISCSQHEGFCVPIADAMLLDRPVFCRPDPAMLEVAGDAAVILPDGQDAQAKARLIADTLADTARLSALAASRQARRAALAPGLEGAIIWQALRQAQP